MNLKNIYAYLRWGLITGCLFGLIRWIIVIRSHEYWHQKMFHLVFLNFITNINYGILFGLILFLFMYFILKKLPLFLKNIFSPLFEIKVTIHKKFSRFLKILFFCVVLLYSLILLIIFLTFKEKDPNLFINHAIIIIFLFVAFFFFSKTDFLALKSLKRKPLYPKAINRASVFIVIIFFISNMTFYIKKTLNVPPTPNVLLIVPDALRADHLGCYGYERPTSPFIDDFAKESIVFKHAFSNAPWTKPSMGTVFTSLYPNEHGAYMWNDSLLNSCLTLAEVLKNKNYNTFAVQTNPIIDRKFNFNQGFARFIEKIYVKANSVTDKFNDWLKNNKNKPFFAYLHYMDTHLPYNAPDKFTKIFEPEHLNSYISGEFYSYEMRILNEMGFSKIDKKHIINLYDSEIRYFDFNFQKIINNLKKFKLYDETLIILVSDHGEEFWEHKGILHAHSLYNEVIHVPLIIKPPHNKTQKQITSHVQLLNLYPTILNIADIKIPNIELRGNNLAQAFKENKEVHEEIFIEGILLGSEKKSIIKNDWKLIKNTGIKKEEAFELLGDFSKYKPFLSIQGYELYNLSEDLNEEENLAGRYPLVKSQLQQLLNSYINHENNIKKEEIDKKKLEVLKSLGYIK